MAAYSRFFKKNKIKIEAAYEIFWLHFFLITTCRKSSGVLTFLCTKAPELASSSLGVISPLQAVCLESALLRTKTGDISSNDHPARHSLPHPFFAHLVAGPSRCSSSQLGKVCQDRMALPVK